MCHLKLNSGILGLADFVLMMGGGGGGAQRPYLDVKSLNRRMPAARQNPLVLLNKSGKISKVEEQFIQKGAE